MADRAPQPHGTKRRYNLGCRCDACRRANSAYCHMRKKSPPAYVSVAEVRAHVLRLRRQGIGVRAIYAACDFHWRTLQKILTGQQKWIRPETAARILAVDEGARADSSTVPARPTYRAIARLLRLGLTRGEIARRIGLQRDKLDFRKVRVELRTEHRILRLLREVEAEVERDRTMPRICPDCAMSHARADRLESVARLYRWHDAPTFADAHEAWPCIYPATDAGERLYERDRMVVVGPRRKAAA